MQSADCNKSSEVITMEIQKFSEFAKQEEDKYILGKQTNIRGLPWKIFVRLYKPDIDDFPRGLSSQKCLGFFLECNEGNEDTNWRCHASVVMKLLAQKEGKEDFVREYQHVFHANENNWGYRRLMALEYLMDPESDWYNRSADSIKFSVEINANIPYGNIPYGIEMQCSENMGNLIDQGDQYSDCILAAEGKEFKVYKGILACRSPVFAAMFKNNEMIEAQNGIVQIEDIRSEVLEQMLRFIYTGIKPKMENMADEELLIAAERYQIEQLKMICECELSISMNIENVCELLILASQHSAAILKAISIDYISDKENTNEVTKTEGWKMLIQGKYSELFDQIVKAMIVENY